MNRKYQCMMCDKDNFVDVLEVNQEEYTSMPEYGKRVHILSETNKKLEEKEVVEEKEDKKNDQNDSKVCHLIFSFMLTLFKRRQQVKMRMKARNFFFLFLASKSHRNKSFSLP